MKFVYSYTTKQNERREGLVIRAASRDAAYSALNRRGIRPFRLEPAPGVWNRLSGFGVRGGVILALALALGAVAHRTFVQRREIAELERDGGVRELLAEAISAKVRRQVIGDQAVIERGVRTGWSDAFADEGERFLASFAIPGVAATVRSTSVAELEAALARRVEIADSDGIEVRQIKAMVEGMKDELRRYCAAGGTIEEYGRRLVARQETEMAIYSRTASEIEQAVESGMDREAVAELVDRRNGELRRAGIRPVQMPE